MRIVLVAAYRLNLQLGHYDVMCFNINSWESTEPNNPVKQFKQSANKTLVSDYPDSFAALFFNVFAAKRHGVSPNGTPRRPV